LTREAILEVRDLRAAFDVKRLGRKLRLQAVDGVSLSLGEGEVLGIVGESGCGKTTVGRSIIRLSPVQSGAIVFKGTDVLAAHGARLRELRLRIRMVFQDPYASLNPRRSIGDSVAEAGDINGAFASPADRSNRIAETLSSVGLDPTFAGRYPHELSGGQRQRVGIARAILPAPEVIIADEPVSALDVSVQAQVLNLLLELQSRLRLTFLFVAHDLSVVRHICDRVAVMYVGQLVELAPTDALFSRPRHPYTAALMRAVPVPDPRVSSADGILRGEVPSPASPPTGCYFHPRCVFAEDRCRLEAPVLREVAPGHFARCHFAAELELSQPGNGGRRETS
jgi:oligopeptide/dipeptide ABC transporter ATP-binding protein